MNRENPERCFHCVHYIKSIREELGGVVRSVLTLCEILAERGHRVTVITGNTQDVPQTWFSPDPMTPQVIAIDYPRHPLFPLPKETMKQIRAQLSQADVVHLHPLWDPVNLRFAELAKAESIPYVVSLHGMLDNWAFSQGALKKRAYMLLYGHRYLRGAAALHCTAQGELDQARLRAPQCTFRVAPHYFDWASFATLPGPELARGCYPVLNSNKLKILSLSRLHPVKGFDVLIRAVAQLISKGMNVSLILAGPDYNGNQSRLEHLALNLGIGDAVHFLGMVRGAEKVSLYQACDLFALPTAQENFGMVLVEAMAAGLPLVTTPHVDIWPELESAGAVITERNPEAFANGISKLLAKPSDLAELGQDARASMFKWLDKEAVTSMYEDIYGDCIQPMAIS